MISLWLLPLVCRSMAEGAFADAYKRRQPMFPLGVHLAAAAPYSLVIAGFLIGSNQVALTVAAMLWVGGFIAAGGLQWKWIAGAVLIPIFCCFVLVVDVLVTYLYLFRYPPVAIAGLIAGLVVGLVCVFRPVRVRLVDVCAQREFEHRARLA